MGGAANKKGGGPGKPCINFASLQTNMTSITEQWLPRMTARPANDRVQKLLIWTVMPTHHQTDFFAALRDKGFDVVVHYYDTVSGDRLQLGWQQIQSLAPGEKFVGQSVSSLSLCPDWRERIHILPGYAKLFLVGLALRLSMRGVQWLHWSEPSRPFARTLRGDAIRRVYAALVNRYALGALAIGDMARLDFLRWGIANERVRYLPYSVAPLTSQPRTTNAMDSSMTCGAHFLFVGAFCKRKGIDVLLQAFALVLEQYPDARLELVGADESDGTYHRMANALALGERVQFLPPVPASEVAKPLSACDVFVLASRFDGWGVVLNEAASLGKAIIATNACGAAHHLVREGENGFMVPVEDVSALAEAMRVYCRDRDLVRKHGQNSLELFEEVRPDRNALRLIQALQSLRAADRRPQRDRHRAPQ
jgi:glycosyltransferase involved in cell wall biosynthesis